MNFGERVTRLTQETMLPHYIESVASKFERRKFEAWRDAPERAAAERKAAQLNNGKRITDRRTRGYKHLAAVREGFMTEYISKNPRQPDEEPRSNVLMSRILSR